MLAARSSVKYRQKCAFGFPASKYTNHFVCGHRLSVRSCKMVQDHRTAWHRAVPHLNLRKDTDPVCCWMQNDGQSTEPHNHVVLFERWLVQVQPNTPTVVSEDFSGFPGTRWVTLKGSGSLPSNLSSLCFYAEMLSKLFNKHSHIIINQ